MHKMREKLGRVIQVGLIGFGGMEKAKYAHVDGESRLS